MSTQVIAPDIATLSGQLSVWQERAKQAEKRANELDARLTAQAEKMSELIFTLLKHGVAIPGSAKPTVEIISGEGWLAVGGAMRFEAGAAVDEFILLEAGAAVDEFILQLMDHARRAFPSDFPEVF